MASPILFVIGASGTGKTAAIEALEDMPNNPFECYQFDSIGVPSSEEMNQTFGSPDEWQADATQRWVQKLSTINDSVSILEGQTRPGFIKDALTNHPNIKAKIVLLDCTQDIRNIRLIQLRNQPELASKHMESWANYLRHQAKQHSLKIIDTSNNTAADVAKEILALAISLEKSL